MLRSTVTIPANTCRNTFSATTGSSAPVTVSTQFTSKQYVDNAISNIVIPEQDLSAYLQRAGGEMTGSLFLVGDPLNELEPATKRYVDA